MDRFPELQILISEKKRESSFINKEEALERGLLFLCLYLGSMIVRGRPMVISSGARAGMQGSRATLSPEIFGLHASCTIRGGDFSTPQRFRRNDGRGAANTVISSRVACRYGADGKRSHDTLNREISRRNAARTIRGGDFSTPLRSATVEMTEGASGFSVIRGVRFLHSAPLRSK